MISFEKKIGVMRQDILDEQGELCAQAKLAFGVTTLADPPVKSDYFDNQTLDKDGIGGFNL